MGKWKWKNGKETRKTKKVKLTGKIRKWKGTYEEIAGAIPKKHGDSGGNGK
jgi:hypothetical protein